MSTPDYALLETLVNIPAASGHEGPLKEFILKYVAAHSSNWSVQPTILDGDFHDGFMLVFGKPRTVVYAHLDTVGFTVAYDNKLVPIGSPDAHNGDPVQWMENGRLEQSALVGEGDCVAAVHTLPRGTQLTYVPNFQITDTEVTTSYLDNRLGVWNALHLAETMQDGVLAFSTMEEAEGRGVIYMTKYLFEHYGIRQALVTDVTWASEGVRRGAGAVISLRDRGIPRQSYLNKIIALAQTSGTQYQLEVESDGSSDGGSIQDSGYPVDWCFIGTPIEGMHSCVERALLKDIEQFHGLSRYLMEQL